MAPQFIGEGIDVITEGDPKEPTQFTWRDKAYTITEIMYAWSDWGFSPAARKRNWRSRRHRNYYRIRTNSDEVLEIYLDRGTKPGREAWFLYQRLSGTDVADL